MDESTISTHPSYAQIKAARVHSDKPVVMYGSDIRHGHYIVLTISESELHRNLNRDWHHDRKQIIQVRMSETQFAEFITSLNVGGGTTCTIERRYGAAVEEPPFADKSQTVKDEFKNKVTELAKTLGDAQTRLDALLKPGAKINKAELGTLKDDIDKAEREIRANMPYMVDSFTETIEETVGEAKGTIEAFVQHAASHAGLSESMLAGACQIPYHRSGEAERMNTCTQCGSQAKSGRIQECGNFWCWLCEYLVKGRKA